jgi:outer membrane lipoprotein-sorting protein
MNKIARRRALLLVSAWTVAPAVAGAQSGASSDLYARMQKLNAGLKSYQAAFHVDVHMRSFLPLNPSLDGIAYYKQPDKNAIVFNTVPILAQQFKKIYPQLEPQSEWPKLYDVAPVSDDGTTSEFRLVRKKAGRIEHVDVTVDDKTATVTSMTYVYRDGGSVSFQQTYRAIEGNYVLATQTGKVDLPQYKADVASTFSNYKLNVAIDDGVFAPE